MPDEPSTGRPRSPSATGRRPASRWWTRSRASRWHASRAELLHRLGRTAAARTAYQSALDLDLNEPQRDHLRRRLADLS